MIYISRNSQNFLGKWWWTLDRTLFFWVIILMSIGVVLVLAAGPAEGFSYPVPSFYFAKRHIASVLLGLGLMVLFSFLRWPIFCYLCGFLFMVSLAGIVLTKFLGPEIKGARRWLVVGGVSVQFSELIRPCLVVLCGWFLEKEKNNPSFWGKEWALLCVGLSVLFVFMQPDVGSSFLMLATCFFQFFLAGLSWGWIFLWALMASIVLLGAYWLFPHVALRLNHFFDPYTIDPYGSHFQISQSIKAFIRGGALGVGPGEGHIKKTLPDAHTDFIFSVGAEEFGGLLCLVILSLYVWIGGRLFARIWGCVFLGPFLAASGLTLQFSLQILVNLATVLALIPPKGMTLPFLSYGGSSVVSLSLGFGILFALTRKKTP